MVKYLSFCLLLLTISCNEKQKKTKEPEKRELCVSNIKYTDYENDLGLPGVDVYFLGESAKIKKGVKEGLLTDIIFYSVPENKRKMFGLKYAYYEEIGDTLLLANGSNFFDADQSRNWTADEIDSYLKKEGVGLVIGKDTIRVKSCTN